MGYISDFGTGFAARILVLGTLALLNVPGNAQAQVILPAAATLDIAITGLRSAKGNVLVCLTANPKYFPDCGKDPKAIKQAVAAGQARAMQFAGVIPGTYAMALVHDENANNKMDVAVFLPREGFAFSRNPAVVFGPPSFKASAFELGAGVSTQRLTMKYML
jgi:uncharacterized protein (DUF2141 family)